MAKSITKNSFFNVIYRGFTALFPLITTAYVARMLLPEGVGKVEYARTIVTYFTMIASLGIPNYGIKAIAQNSRSKSERSKTFMELFLINAISNFLVSIIYFIFVNSIPYFEERRLLFNIMGIMLILNFFNIDWFYAGTEEYVVIAMRSILVKILSFIAVIIFVHSTEDYCIYAAILCMAIAGNYIFNLINLRNRVILKKQSLNLKQHIKPVLTLLAASIATEVYTMLDTIMLEYFHGEISVGLYSNSVKIVRMVYALIIAMVATFYPRISSYVKEKKYEESNKLISIGISIISLLSIPCSVGIILMSNYVIQFLFGTEYLAAIPTLSILGVLVIIFSIAYFLGHILLMATGREKYILHATVVGAIVNFLINLVLIPVIKQNGAATASVIAEIIVTSIMLYRSKDIYSLKLNGRFWLSTIISVLVMSFSIIIMKTMLPITLYSFVIIVLTAIIVYVGCLFILKNNIAIELYHKYIRKIVKNVIKH